MLPFRPDSIAFVAVACLSLARGAQDSTDRKAVPSTSSSFTCIIVDGRTQAPIQSAEVRWYELDESAETWFDELDSLEDYSQDDVHAAHSGQVATSDRDGRVKVLGSLKQTIVVAQSGPLWGCTRGYDGRAAEQRLELFPDATVVAHLVDASGQPASDTPVVIQYRLFGDQPFATLRATTDSHGVARLAHAGFGLAQVLSGWSDDSAVKARWSIAAHICAAERPESPLDPRALPSETVELRLPQLGEVEVIVSESDGRAARLEVRPTLLYVANLPERDESGMTKLPIGFAAPRVRAQATDGHALFRGVGLGAELALRIQPNTASKERVERFRGPTQPGERVSHKVVLEDSTPTFVGRLVATSDRPLANASVTTELFSLPSPNRVKFVNRRESETIHARGGEFRTDADGRFWLCYTNEAAHHGKPMLVFTTDRNQPTSLAVRIDLSEHWEAGLHDLGDIELTPTPIIAAGKVVDATGQPIEGVWLGINVFKGSPHIAATTDASGDFALRSAEPHDELSISVAARDRPSTSLSPAPGTLDLRVVLALAGSIEGRVLLPAGIHDSDISIGLVPAAGAVGGTWSSLHAESTFRFADLQPGRYTLKVTRRPNYDVLVERRDLLVEPGRPLVLDAIELPATVRARDLRVVGPDAEPIAAGHYLVVVPGATSPEAIWTSDDVREFDNGSLRITTTQPSVDVAVAVEGYRIGWFRDVQPNATLELARGIRVAIELTKALEAPPKNTVYRLGLIQSHGENWTPTLNPVVFRSTPFDEHGRAEIVAPGPGEYGLRWIVEKGTWSSTGHEDPEQRVTILEQSELQTLKLEPRYESKRK